MITCPSELREQSIAAVATPPGAGGICVVRISGGNVFQTVNRLLGAKVQRIELRSKNTFFHTTIYDCETGESIDDALVLIFHAPHSYTGENTVEIQGHGGVIPAQRILNAVLKAGARMAEPGEFTRRAFLNGNLDLTQAEAVCDLIQSQTERAAAAARVQLDGALGGEIHNLYHLIVGLSADLEHVLDFDEGEIADNFVHQTVRQLQQLKLALERLISTWREGELLRRGVLIVLSGAPNAGKSSLLNALLRRDRAIVHNLPGTTRDVIEESYSLSGIPARLVDTAGLRNSEDEVEHEGVQRAYALIQQADLNLLVIDQHAMEREQLDSIVHFFNQDTLLLVLNKSDLPAGQQTPLPCDAPMVAVSAVTGEGLDDLKAVMKTRLGITDNFQSHSVISQRHLEELRTAARAVEETLQLLTIDTAAIVIAAGYLREGSEALGRITGRVYSEDLLNNIFGKFCVGK
ncbi:MAG: tRNA uridine-5-carboxymethylaminomethyl(34) synthesis GTPase MnmE [Kiritimatiellia bacterium]